MNMQRHNRFTFMAAPLIVALGVLAVGGTNVAQAAPFVRPMGTVRAGPDGDWVLKRSSGVSYAQQARIRYQCDIRAVEQTGFDPTEDDGGVPLDEFAGKRADYLRTEAACLEAHGYLVQ